ncbi:MAG: FAD-dependent oxidoreductase, partial [Candidatus Methylacidiphilales bacterium]
MHSKTYCEPARHIPIIEEADVVVLGGGPGGIGAALAAARNGAKTVIVERFGSFGGTWTAGILGAIMAYPFVRGIFAELVEKLKERDGWVAWGNGKYGAGGTYDTETAKVVLDELITSAGVIPYFFMQFADVIVEDGRVIGVIVESKEGRGVILGKQFIDSTGDGDVSVRAGAGYDLGREKDGALQPMTMIFRMDDVENARVKAYKEGDPSFARAWMAAKERGEVTVPREDVLAFEMPRKGQWNMNTTRIIGKDGTRVRDVTDAMMEGRRQVAEVASFLVKHIPGFENAVLTETAPHVGVRETRRIHCDYTIEARNVVEAIQVDDCIARGDWYIDIHSPTGEGTERVYPPEGKWYEIPFRSIRVRGFHNLLVASRCLDCTHEAHAAVRITPQMVAIGQGAGTAAAMCAAQCLASTRD